MYRQTIHKSGKQGIKPASYRLPVDLLDELKEVAESSDVSQTIIVREAITEKLKKIRGKKLAIGIKAETV